jgi:hypothetical protein
MCKLEAKVGREAILVSFNGLIEGLRRDAVERGEVFVQENPVAAQDQYPALDLISGDDFVGHDEME